LDRVTVSSLNRRLLRNLLDGTTDAAEGEMAVPASAFCCPERFALERDRLFLQVPQPVAFSAEIPTPGSYLALDVMTIPVLLARDAEGELRAFVNSCSHRGAQVARGSGTTRHLVCPFHGWAYGPDGRLQGRPGDRYFSTPASACNLAPLPVAEKYGVVMIGIGPHMPQSDVDCALDEIGPDLDSLCLNTCVALDRRQFDVGANWKLVNDLSLESYHFRTLHRDSVAQVLADNAVIDTYNRHSRWAFPLTTIAQLADVPEAEWPDTLQGSCTYTLYPGVMLIVNETGAQMIRAEPGAHPGESRVCYIGVRRPELEQQAAQRAFDFGGEVFEGEDLPVAEQCQRGIAAGGRDLLLGRNEPLLQFWHGLWAEAIRE
jgi:phenylpropionate dioxygenase-like ring-hydroxylating dioxygenase large terminal subunit